MQKRVLPRSLAGVVQELELRQPVVVTKALLAEIAQVSEVQLAENALAERLVRYGWLLPLRRRNSWEFAPGSRAGRFASGDSWIELRALLEHTPHTQVAIAFDSALWELGYSTHQPAQPIVAHPSRTRLPKTLEARKISFDWHLPTNYIRGLPVWQVATVVVGASERPAAQANWANADDWLIQAFQGLTISDLLAEAEGRTSSTLARLGYLAEWSGREDIAKKVEELLPDRLPVTSLGPRDQRDRWSRRWHVYDALLPNR